MTSEMTRESETRWRSTTLPSTEALAKAKTKAKGRGAKQRIKVRQTRQRVLRVQKEKVTSHEIARHEATKTKTVNEVESERTDVDDSKRVCVHDWKTVDDITLSQRGCEGHEDGLVMIDSGASVNVGPGWFGESALNSRVVQSDYTPRVRKATGLVESRQFTETM